MSLHDEIFSWVKRQPAWKQQLYLRSAVKPELEPRDIEEVSDILLGRSEHIPAPREVTRDDLPGAHDGGQAFAQFGERVYADARLRARWVERRLRQERSR